MTTAGLYWTSSGRRGRETAFGLPGVHNLQFWRDAGPEAPELMLVRHEQTTVYAADGSRDPRADWASHSPRPAPVPPMLRERSGRPRPVARRWS